MKLEEIIGQRLSEARKAAGLTQQGLGVAAGIEEETAKVRVHQYEHAKHPPPYSVLERLASVLGKPVVWFVCSEEQKDVILQLSRLTPTELSQTRAQVESLLKNRPSKTL